MKVSITKTARNWKSTSIIVMIGAICYYRRCRNHKSNIYWYQNKTPVKMACMTWVHSYTIKNETNSLTERLFLTCNRHMFLSHLFWRNFVIFSNFAVAPNCGPNTSSVHFSREPRTYVYLPIQANLVSFLLLCVTHIFFSFLCEHHATLKEVVRIRFESGSAFSRLQKVSNSIAILLGKSYIIIVKQCIAYKV